MQVLSRTQSNDIFTLIKRVGLEPGDFDYHVQLEDDDKEAAVFTHKPTGSWLSIRLSREHLWLTWWPKFGSGAPNALVKGWDEARDRAFRWLQAIKQDHDAPDLWVEARKEHKLSDAAGAVGEANTPFTAEEFKLLEQRLPEVEAFIEARQPLDAEQKKQLRGRFGYLLEAAKRGIGRVDWLNIFVGQMFQMAAEGILQSSIYGAVMSHAATLLGGILKIGTKLLGG